MSAVQTLWNEIPGTCDLTDFRAQVGMTVKGRAISDDQFQLVLSEIERLLRLEEGDELFDLCCGNGLITHELSKKCRGALGIDFSSPLLDIAHKEHNSPNITYRFLSVLDDYAMNACGEKRFNKVLLYTTLQFFSESEFERVLHNLLPLVTDDFVMLIGNIPDRSKWPAFYDSPGRKLQHFLRKLSGSEHLAVWWSQKELERLCRKLGLRCVCHEQDARMYNSHFRFDAVVNR